MQILPYIGGGSTFKEKKFLSHNLSLHNPAHVYYSVCMCGEYPNPACACGSLPAGCGICSVPLAEI